MNEMQRHTLAVLVDNESGVLSKVSNLFSRKGFNIESLAVGTTDDPKISRITIEVITDEARVELLCNQLRKLFPVHFVKRLTPEVSIRRELVLIKTVAKTSDVRSEIFQIANIFHANVIDVGVDSLTIAVIGNESKIEGIQRVLARHGILELVRTGMVAVERGGFTLEEQTKEKDEFDLGKNVR